MCQKFGGWGLFEKIQILRYIQNSWIFTNLCLVFCTMNVVCYECYVVSQFLLLIKNGKQSIVVCPCLFYVIFISLKLFYRVTCIDFVGTKIYVWEWKYIFIFRLVSRHPTSSNTVISQDGGDKSSSATGPRELTPCLTGPWPMRRSSRSFAEYVGENKRASKIYLRLILD